MLGGALRLAGFSIFKLIRYLRDELMIVLGTASSDSVLPQVMRKLEKMGIKDSTVGLVIPTGYSFNLDAFSIYLTLAAVFIAQATNTPLSFMSLLVILGVALITSKGAHGVPGSAIVILAATLTAIPDIPVIGLVLNSHWINGTDAVKLILRRGLQRRVDQLEPEKRDVRNSNLRGGCAVRIRRREEKTDSRAPRL